MRVVRDCLNNKLYTLHDCGNLLGYFLRIGKGRGWKPGETYFGRFQHVSYKKACRLDEKAPVEDGDKRNEY